MKTSLLAAASMIALAASIALAADIHVDSAAAALDADPGVARLADLKPLALQAHGLRRAGATSPTTVQVVIGASMTGAAGKAEAYRIIGEGDPAYAYRDFVRPVKAAILNERKNAEFTVPEGFAAPKAADIRSLTRTVVELTLPAPLKEGRTYHVVAIGVGSEMVTAGKTAASFAYRAAEPYRDDPAGDVLGATMTGLRRITSVGNGVLLLEFGAGYSVPGGNKLAHYAITVNGKPVSIHAMGRRSKIDVYLPVGWPFKGLLQHEVFLDIGAPLKNGDVVRVEAAPAVVCGATAATLVFDDRESFSSAIKVNQVGYVPDGLKLARVGRWLGSFPDPAAKPAAGAAGAAADDGAAGMSAAALFAKGPVIDATSPVDGHTAFHRSLAPWALRFDAPPAFEIRRADTHEAVLSGTATLKSNGGEVDGRVNHSAENVFEIDFTSFETPGRYYIAIAGVGRSFAFGVGEDVYQTAFETQAYGVFAQRCGQELAPPYSDWERIACHVAGVVPTTEKRHLTHEFGKFVENRIPVVLPASGGHHDAGDYNPRSHIDVAQTLLTAYELFPKKFFDGQLNIPEKANGIPDIVDEALWALRLWDGLYDPETGAVYNGTESQGDPNFIQTVELDDKGDYAWAPDAQGALNYAGTLAQTARILAASGKTEQAAASLARAEKAYAWGKANKPGVTDVRAFGRFYVAPLAFAAAQLFHATGKPGCHEDFLANTPWRANPQAEMIAGDGAYDLSLAACAYALMPDAQADAAVKRAALASIRREADMYIDGSSKMAYAFIRHPYAPITWGTGAYHNFCMPAPHLAALAESPEDRARYREWLIRSADNTLGGNPMNLSWVVGLGSQTIRAPLHNSRYSKFGMPVRGMQSEGPNQRGEGYNYGETVYPKHSDSFAVMHAFIDSSFAIAMDEGVVPLQAKSMALFGALLPDHP